MKHAARYLLFLFFSSWICLPAQTWSQTSSTIEEVLPLLPGLEKPVEFWKKIFTEYSLSQLVFFDPLDMSRIYEVLEVGEENRPQSYIDGERARIAGSFGVEVERVQAQRGIKERMFAGLKRSG